MELMETQTDQNDKSVFGADGLQQENTEVQNAETPPLQANGNGIEKLVPRLGLSSRFTFPLRGHSLNPIIDASSPLLALTLRFTSLESVPDVEELYKSIVNEIRAIEDEVRKQGYDRVHILTHRYCLCTIIDEAVMSTSWGAASGWSEKSLLATFHNETWGGEKYFVVLDRILSEPSRYLSLIEFLYLGLSLGFEGKYRVMHNGRAQIDEVLRETHEVIRRERGETPEVLLNAKANHSPRMHQVSRRFPTYIVWLVAAAICAGAYATFYVLSNDHTDKVVENIQKIL